jgi:hypothetical protein
MVVAVGFEPTVCAVSKFSLLLIFAFLFAYLHAKIQAFPSYDKDFLASSGNNGKKKTCRGVSPDWHVSAVCRVQRWLVSVSDCVAGCGVEFPLGWPLQSHVLGLLRAKAGRCGDGLRMERIAPRRRGHRGKASEIYQPACPPLWRRRSAACTLAHSYRQRLPILMYGRIPFAFQLPKVRRLTGNLASSLFSSMKPCSPVAPAVEKFVCSLLMCFLSFCNNLNRQWPTSLASSG